MLDYQKWRKRLLAAWRRKVEMKARPHFLPNYEEFPETVVRKFGKYRICLCIHEFHHTFIFFSRRPSRTFSMTCDWQMQQPELLSFLGQTEPIE